MKKMKILSVLLMFLTIQMVSAQKSKDYYFSKTLKLSFEETTTKVKEALKAQGFGVISEIDMDKKLKEKLDDVDLKPYRILGACNPGYAYQTIQEEENIGLFLPCKVLIKDLGNGKTEVVMVNPSALMSVMGNNKLDKIAKDVTKKFKAALKEL
ncbi:MAG: DUF302 domain-containing protein [Bacteroidales bacterium]|nr:DUF302 domain-containing protein [Bacteroidales bacterium]